MAACLLMVGPFVQAAEVHAQPDASSPVIARLPVGTTPTPATGFGAVPTGWTAVELPGPHQVFVHNNDLSKNLQILAGVPMHREPSVDSPVLATAGETEPAELTGLRGRWTQFRLDRPLMGYVRNEAPAAAPAVSSAAATAPAPSPAPATAPATSTPPAPETAPTETRNASAGTAAPMINLGDGGASALSRLFEGRLESTRHPLRPRRPYDYQIMDERGSRYAYVDVSRLLLTEQLDNFLTRQVVIYGGVRTVPGTDDLVIMAESLKLR